MCLNVSLRTDCVVQIVNEGYKPVEGIKQLHSGQRLPFHADQGCTDIISLGCLSAAVEGGTSK